MCVRVRGGCVFSHQLDSAHTQEILRQHQLESLSRPELCTLLLQNDCSLLPPVGSCGTTPHAHTQLLPAPQTGDDLIWLYFV